MTLIAGRHTECSVSEIINAFVWHAYHLLTFRPAITALPSSRNLAFGLVALSTILVVGSAEPIMAILHVSALLFVLLKFQQAQIVIGLCLISIPINATALIWASSASGLHWVPEALHLYESILWVFTSYRWLQGPKR